MKIDKIINEIKETADSAIIITNQKTIDVIFDELENELIEGEYGKFSNENSNNVKGVSRNGVEVYFISEDDIVLNNKNLVLK